jgi:hypothetical protein
MDAAARSFARRFPNAGRVGSEAIPDPRRDRAREARINAARFAKEDAVQLARGGIATDAAPAGIKPFAERFPNAGRVGSV